MATTMSELLTTLGNVFTFLIDQMSDVFDFILGNPICMIGLGIALAGTIIAFARRFIRTR